MTEEKEVLLGTPLVERRKHLEYVAKNFEHSKTFFLSAMTLDIKKVRAWLKTAGDNLDGMVCKRRDSGYQSGVSARFSKGKELSQYRLRREILSKVVYGK
jgi:ATP-dependent DNA ligase